MVPSEKTCMANSTAISRSFISSPSGRGGRPSEGMTTFPRARSQGTSILMGFVNGETNCIDLPAPRKHLTRRAGEIPTHHTALCPRTSWNLCTLPRFPAVLCRPDQRPAIPVAAASRRYRRAFGIPARYFFLRDPGSSTPLGRRPCLWRHKGRPPPLPLNLGAFLSYLDPRPCRTS